MNAMFFGMPMALFPAIAKGYGGAEVLGLLYAAPSAGSIVVDADERLDAARAPPRPRGRAAARPAGAWRSSVFGFADALWLALRAWSWRAGSDTISGDLPRRDLERDDPRPPARPAGRRGDDLVVVGPAARQRRGGLRRRAGRGARRRSSPAASCAWWVGRAGGRAAAACGATTPRDGSYEPTALGKEVRGRSWSIYPAIWGKVTEQRQPTRLLNAAVQA